MTTRRNGFEGQVDGGAVTTTNSAASGSAFTTVSAGSGGTIVYSSTHPGDGTLGVAFTGGGAAGCYVEDASFNDASIADEFVFWFSGTAPTNTSQIFGVRSGAGQHFGLNINTAKQIIIASSTGGVLGSMTTVLTAGFWRVAIQGTSDAAAGTVNVQLYPGAQSITATETKSLTAVNTRGGNMTLVRHGLLSTAAFGSTFYMDSLQTADGTTTALGPMPATASASVRPTSVASNPGAWVTDSGGVPNGASLADESDASYNTNPGVAATEAITYGLGSLTTGAITLKVRALKPAAGSVANLKVEFFEGATVRATRLIDPTTTTAAYDSSSGYADYVFDLTPTENAAVTDRTVLSGRCTANGS